jgi:hypothetical protein
MARQRKVIFRRLRGQAAQRAFDAYLRMGRRDVYRQPIFEGVQTFSVFCPKRARKPAYQVGTSFIMPEDLDDPTGRVFTCFMPLIRQGRLIHARMSDEEAEKPGRDCKQFANRAAALAWLTQQAEELEC